MKILKVESTVIDNITYNRTRKDLKVTFKNKSSYIYTPVSQDFFAKIENSESKGKFFNKHIKDNEALSCLKMIN